jgi:hypothetical protein
MPVCNAKHAQHIRQEFGNMTVFRRRMKFRHKSSQFS